MIVLANIVFYCIVLVATGNAILYHLSGVSSGPVLLAANALLILLCCLVLFFVKVGNGNRPDPSEGSSLYWGRPLVLRVLGISAIGIVYYCAIAANLQALRHPFFGASTAKSRDSQQIKLINATASEDVREVREALAEGADPNRRGRLGFTPASLALHKDNPVPILEALIDAGLDVNAPYTSDMATSITLLPDAILKKKGDVIVLLLAKGADVNMHADMVNSYIVPLGLVAQDAELVPYVGKLARAAGDVDTVSTFTIFSEVTPLQLAAFSGNAGAYQELIAAGADWNQVATSKVFGTGFTTLMFAAAGGNPSIINDLITTRGMDVAATTSRGTDAYEIAKLHKAASAMSILRNLKTQATSLLSH